MWAVRNGSRVQKLSNASLAQAIPKAHEFGFIITLPLKPGTDQHGSCKDDLNLLGVPLMLLHMNDWSGEQLTHTALPVSQSKWLYGVSFYILLD